MIQEMFPGSISGGRGGWFVGLLSLRQHEFLLVVALRRHRPPGGVREASFSCSAPCCTPWCLCPRRERSTLFVIGSFPVISMYGGGFATIHGYLRDMFRTIEVGAIHGRLLTA